MAELLKNQISSAYVENICNVINQHVASFDKQQCFNNICNDSFAGKELKQRILHMANEIFTSLHMPYDQAIMILANIADEFNGYAKYDALAGLWLPTIIEHHGLDDVETSLNAMEVITHYASCEFAIRPFISRYPERLLTHMLHWTSHRSEHVRRLASEGCRPLLPWGKNLTQLKENPEPIFTILDQLINDESLYVRKSVANNINDISKNHADKVLNWSQYHRGRSDYTDWIIKKSLRTLLKQAHPGALKIFGYMDPQLVEEASFDLLDKVVAFNQRLQANITLKLKNSGLVRVEMIVHFKKKNGALAPKVFHVSDSTLADGVSQFQYNHHFKSLTTRHYYDGVHMAELRVNGKVMEAHKFELINVTY